MSTTTSIVKTPDILGGKPRIKGTRISVFMIAESIRETDQTVETILDGYPDLSREQVEEALDYYDEHPETMDVLRTQYEAEKQNLVERNRDRYPET